MQKTVSFRFLPSLRWPSQPTKEFYAQMKKFVATIQSLNLKYSVTPNLDIWKKLDFCKWHQLITTQNQNTLNTFQIQWARRHSIVANTMPTGPPYLKCIKKNLEKKKQKKNSEIFSWYISSTGQLEKCWQWHYACGPVELEMLQEKLNLKFFFKIKKLFANFFQVWRACRHNVSNDNMPTGPSNLKCFKKNKIK
jgi:hypothetical protein